MKSIIRRPLIYIPLVIMILGGSLILFSAYQIGTARDNEAAYHDEFFSKEKTGSSSKESHNEASDDNRKRDSNNYEKINKIAESDSEQEHTKQSMTESVPDYRPSISTEGVMLYPKRPSDGDSIGKLFIPRLEKDLPILHGTDPDELEKGVGHVAQSVLPGENDNSVLSGHRDTVFRQLGKLEKGDLLVVETSAGSFTYQIRSTQIVEADDRSIIVPKDSAFLTLTTCYPFYYVGDAPQRYIVSSELVEENRTP